MLSSFSFAAQDQSPWFAHYNPSAASKWAAALNRAGTMTPQMTSEELNNVTYGFSSACSGMTGSVPRVGWDGLCMNDAGEGVRGTDLVNAYAEGISIGASWNAELAYERARYMGAEFRRKGVKVALGPVIEPIGRTALNGRNMEGFGADPSLAGKLAAASVRGLQASVIASVKHFVGYEQELDRMPIGGNPVSVSSNINDKDMHELYLWAFQDAVAAGAASIMCSYNRVNQTYACENDAALNGLLKGELNFPGFVVSDWSGQHSGDSAAAGLDVAMPSSSYWDNGQLVAAVNNGTLSKERLLDMATRQLAASYYVFGDITSSPPNGYGLVTDYTAPHPLVDGRDPASKPNRLQQAIEGHVLVKNTNNALPLQKPKILSLFGYDGRAQMVNSPSSNTLSNYGWAFGTQVMNASVDTLLQAMVGGKGDILQSATGGTLFTGLGSGASTPAYISDPFSAISDRAYDDDTYLWWDFKSYEPQVSAISDACLVFVNDVSTEGVDRAGLADPVSDSLVLNVAAKCANTIVVIHNTYIRLVDAFYDHPNVTAIVYAHLPGQDSGRALVKLLWGDKSPSGKLPYTVAKNASDYGQLLHGSGTPVNNSQSDFSQPSLFDYRYFQANNIEPRFPFGFGLTYTTFTYGNITVSSTGFRNASTSPPNPNRRIPGGVKSLFDPLVSVSVTVTNSGSVDAAEVVQIYLQFPGEKTHLLRGFRKIEIPHGSTQEFAIDLSRRDLSRWDVTSQQWLLPNGTTTILVGASSADIRASAILTR